MLKTKILKYLFYSDTVCEINQPSLFNVQLILFPRNILFTFKLF